MWFRHDLRVYDNPALAAACKGGGPVIAIYVFTPEQLRQHQVGDTKLRFTLETLVELKRDLAQLNIPLLALLGTDYTSSIHIVTKLAQQYKVAAVHANSELELNEQQRDRKAEIALQQAATPIFFHRDQTILSPKSVLTGEATPYRVFTPFKRAWIKQITPADLDTLQRPQKLPRLSIESTPDEEVLSWQAPTLANTYWKAGSDEAHKRLDLFTQSTIERYKNERDFPSLDSTSQLSPYLAVGAISLRSCLRQALQVNHFEWDSGSQGILTWISELIWREFYKHLSFHYPELSKGVAFNPKTNHISWSRNQVLLSQWQRGETGFPLVDAGMRQLNGMGWMHNRLRMVTAMFLTKQLFIDWRLGEAYFMQKLIDGDYAANNGGWQWSASTGADAAPYFRVFNPIRQSERFDPEGTFIKTWIPELAKLESKHIHDPSPIERQITGYPLPIVDQKSSVEHVKQTFKAAQAMEPV
jgi:deoxyribodipyrimidine photo-lyase